MEIHFIWINHFRFLKNAGINLSSRFIIEIISPAKSDDEKRSMLVIKSNPDYIPDFFEKNNVTNVTAIIGKNGSGKSSILNYIKSNLPEGLEANVADDLFVYSIKNENSETFHVIESENYPIILDDRTKLFKKETYGYLTGADEFRFTGHLSNVDYIYYSYFLEYNTELTNWKGLWNISTAALLADERRRILEENRDEQTRYQLLLRSSDLEKLALNEVSKAIQFFNSPDSKKLPFVKPTELFLKINLTDELFFSEKNSATIDVFDLLEELHKRNKPKTTREALINNILIGLLINFLIDERKYSMRNPYTHIVAINLGESTNEYVMRFFRSMGSIDFTHGGNSVEMPKHKKLSQLVPEFVLFVEDLLDKKVLLPVPGNDNLAMNLLLNDKTEEAFEKFRNYYLNIKGLSTFFDFNWRSLSTGEQSYLSFMSRFYHIKHHEHGELKKNLAILIDEGDAGYHPDWQRKFFNTTLDFLSDLFAGHSIQLILTANTPFISSDLPKSNILFIEQKPDKSVVFHNKDNSRTETFAANIHTLYSDSFYMDGILIGAFAKKRLDTIIKYLNNKTNRVKILSYKKTIDLIGEPVLKAKLQDMWNEKFGLDEELEHLQKRIEEINQIKKRKKK